jgi:RsiW-degrading membrane proteinase PrsW (M82 family)
LKKEVKAKGIIVLTALVLDFVVLGAFLWIKAKSDPLVLLVSGATIGVVFFWGKLVSKSKSQ